MRGSALGQQHERAKQRGVGAQAEGREFSQEQASYLVDKHIDSRVRDRPRGKDDRDTIFEREWVEERDQKRCKPILIKFKVGGGGRGGVIGARFNRARGS